MECYGWSEKLLLLEGRPSLKQKSTGRAILSTFKKLLRRAETLVTRKTQEVYDWTLLSCLTSTIYATTASAEIGNWKASLKQVDLSIPYIWLCPVLMISASKIVAAFSQKLADSLQHSLLQSQWDYSSWCTASVSIRPDISDFLRNFRDIRPVFRSIPRI